ncbi:MAG: DNA translocase FtsK 4TM domain-containing protein [Anaerolineales bacterium]
MSKQPISPRNQSGTRKRTASSSKGQTSRSTRSSSAQKKPTSQKKKAPTSSAKSRKAAPEPEKKSAWQAFLEDPDALRHLHRYLPAWFDEVMAAILIGLGAVCIASLVSTGGEGELSSVISDLLRQGFGQGALLVALSVLGAGIWLLLPKLGIEAGFRWSRFIGLELGFVSFQGLLHGLAFEDETRALAREGEGGGYVGWAVNNLVVNVAGEPANIAILGVCLVVGVHLTLGIRRRHYRAFFGGISAQLSAMAQSIDPGMASAAPAAPAHEQAAIPATEALDRAPIPQADEPAPIRTEPEPVPQSTAAERDAQPAALAPTTQAGRRPSVVPRQPKPAPPPSQKPSGQRTAPPLTPAATTKAADIQKPTAQGATSILNEDAIPSEPVQASQTPVAAEPKPTLPPAEDPMPATEPDYDMDDRPKLVVNGQVVDASPLTQERQSIVPRKQEDESPKPAVMARETRNYKGGRDDDPHKRYFTVDDFNERRKVGKRSEILPPLELMEAHELNKPSAEEINRNASIIENTLLEFDIDADVIDVKVGPVVTQYAVSPIKEIRDPQTGKIQVNRVRVDKIVNLQGDLALALSAKTLRIEAPVPGHSYVGIEVPNSNPSVVGLRPVLESEVYYDRRKKPLAIPMGRDVSGQSVVIELASLPHLLVAGTTGSGKSVFLASVVTSLVMNNTPDQLKLIMLDPKRVELTRFNGLPHLIGPVETEGERIIGVLRWATREMDRRYKLLELENARNIDAYNTNLGRRRKDEHLPYIVLMIDEIGDLMMSHPDETEGTVTRLAQKARAAGIHLVIATQRPSTDVVTGLIKANFPGRVSFAVASGTDSRVILDYIGAETLLGRGDMLYLAPDAAGPRRIQGCYVDDSEVEEIVLYWKNWYEEQIAEGAMEAPRVAPWERGLTRIEALSEHDPLLEEAIKLVCDAKEASTSMIQRRLGIGYPRAARLMDLLFELGIIGPPKSGGRPREVLVKTSKTALKHLKNAK